MKCVDAGNSMCETDHDVWPIDLTPERARKLEDAHCDCSGADCVAVLAVLAVLLKTHPAACGDGDGPPGL
jgi:hypothetical protein